jgi:antitoxin component YwqK of YwqJK toxin-antitoxin module
MNQASTDGEPSVVGRARVRPGLVLAALLPFVLSASAGRLRGEPAEPRDPPELFSSLDYCSRYDRSLFVARRVTGLALSAAWEFYVIPRMRADRVAWRAEWAKRPEPKQLLTEERRDERGRLEWSRSYYLGADGAKVAHGPEVDYWYNTGEKRWVTSYRHGVRHGVRTEWDMLGRVRSQDQYVAGTQQGPSVEWHEPGKLRSHCVYQDDTLFGRIVGPKVQWHPRGSAVWKVEAYNLAGEQTEEATWHENGRLQSHGTYRVSNGWWDSRPTGQHGLWRFWDDQGRLAAEGEWRYGRPWSGVCRVIFQSGSLGSYVFERYEEGKVVERRVPIYLHSPPAPEPAGKRPTTRPAAAR